jgi:S1-C subfamily serine protease
VRRRGLRSGALAGAAILALLALAGLLAACGDDEETTPADPGTTASTSTTGADSDNGGEDRPAIGETAFDVQGLYAEAAPSVVTVRSILGNPNSIGGGGGQGSGFVVSDDGEIVTNAHVVTDAEQAGGTPGSNNQPIEAANEVFVEFPDRNQVEAEIVGFDPDADVALLKVDPEGLDLEPLEFGDSQAVDVGTGVAAIGSPFGQEQSISTGIVSATDRSIQSLTQFNIDGAIQTDASINPGNSGGPLIDSSGRVIGINQQINTTSGGNEGVGFAVPSNLVQRSIDDLRDDGEASYAFIGVSTIPLYPQLAERLDVDAPNGALIVQTTDGGPAADAGLKGAGDETIMFQGQEIEIGGDVIVAVDGEELEGETALSRVVTERRPGDTVEIEVIRDGERRTIEVTLEPRPDSV